jgi:hypothetical protein
MATTELTPQEKMALITSQLQEVLRSDILEQVVVKENRPLKIYWGRLSHSISMKTAMLTLPKERQQQEGRIVVTLFPSKSNS